MLEVTCHPVRERRDHEFGGDRFFGEGRPFFGRRGGADRLRNWFYANDTNRQYYQDKQRFK